MTLVGPAVLSWFEFFFPPLKSVFSPLGIWDDSLALSSAGLELEGSLLSSAFELRLLGRALELKTNYPLSDFRMAALQPRNILGRGVG